MQKKEGTSLTPQRLFTGLATYLFNVWIPTDL